MLVPAVPFLLSLALSLSTVGNYVYWQDSGYYLAAVKEMALLYPHGFGLYMMLCKLWTKLCSFLDLTLAVHLFSSLCAALAAAAMAVATRALLRTQGPIFRVYSEGPGALADWIGAATACLLASGYTFWFAGIYAKGYSLYYLLLTLLLWRLILADARGTPRDFTLVAILIGFAWAAHPSAAATGLALILFLLCRSSIGSSIGWRGVAWRAALAATCALGPNLLYIVVLANRSSVFAFGDPRSPAELFSYMWGSRFLTVPGVIGWAESRWRSLGTYFLEEYLVVGIGLLSLGILRLLRVNRGLLIGLATWVIPVVIATILFKMEGQHDLWFVAAWLPLWMVAAVGLQEVARVVKRWGPWVAAGVCTAGVAHAALLNYSLLNQRHYDLAELFGRLYLEKLDRDAILTVSTDHLSATGSYLQSVRDFRTDVLLVDEGFLGSSWYQSRIQRHDPGVRMPDYRSYRRRFPRAATSDLVLAAIGNENVATRPVYFEQPPSAELIRDDYVLVQAGPMWKLVSRNTPTIELKYWKFPVKPEAIVPLYNRKRGQSVTFTPTDVHVEPEFYEHRLVLALVRARRWLADFQQQKGTRAGYLRSARLYESMLRTEPAASGWITVGHPLATAWFALGEFDKAGPMFERALQLRLAPDDRARALSSLAVIRRHAHEEAEAAELFRQALSAPDVDAQVRTEIEQLRDGATSLPDEPSDSPREEAPSQRQHP